MHLSTVNWLIVFIVLCSKSTKCYLASAVSPLFFPSMPLTTGQQPRGLSFLHDRMENIKSRHLLPNGKSLQRSEPYVSTRQLVEQANRAAYAWDSNMNGKTVLGEIETIGKIVEVIQSLAGIILPVVIDKASTNKELKKTLGDIPRAHQRT